MKKLISLVLIVILSTTISACSPSKSKEPNEEQIKAICDLSTLECYYNNVAKGTKEKGVGMPHWLEKEREFWIEYEGYAKIGIDMKLVSMKIDQNNVVITMPSAKITDLGIVTKTFNEDSYITSGDNWWNKNKITAEDQQIAINKAQEEMKNTVLKNKTLFEKAENEAKNIITSYINNLGKISGKTYNIIWKKA